MIKPPGKNFVEDPSEYDGNQESLDEVLEQCFLSIEDGTGNLESLVSRFPSWKAEIVELFENLGNFKRVTSNLLPSAQPPSTEIDLSEFPDGKFGDYELLESIGVGGMGVIYRARQISLGRIVALKMVQRHRKDANRFKLEAESAAALSHPNIVSIYEIGEHQGRLFFSMELIEGCNLSDYLKRGPVDIREAARITRTIAEAVHYAHQHGILHRDLKPANILLDIEAQPHVTDFGLAKQLDRDTELTKSGTIMGTPGYMAPEQAAGKTSHLTIATDVYGVGAILYSLLSGQSPFTGESSLETLRRVVDEVPVSPRNLDSRIERDIDTICMKCIEKSPQLRYSTAKLLADDLSRFLLGQPVKARPIAVPERLWRWCLRNPAYSVLGFAVITLMIATMVISAQLTLNEQKTRFLVEEKNRNETRLKQEIAKALSQQRKLNDQERRRRDATCLDNAFRAAANGDSDALLWFSQAAQLASSDPFRFKRNFLRAQSWLDPHPFPLAAWLLDESVARPSAGGRCELEFCPHSEQFLLIRNRQFLLGNYNNNQLWKLENSFPGITCANWSTDGLWLAVGTESGKLIILDSDNREIIQRIEVQHPIDRIAFDGARQVLAVVTSGYKETSGKLLIWGFDKNEWTCPPIELSSRINQIEFSKGKNLLLTDQSQTSHLYRMIQGRPDLILQTPIHVTVDRDANRHCQPTLIADDSILTVCSDSGAIQFIDVETGKLVNEHVLEKDTKFVTVDPALNRMIVRGDRRVDVWKVESVDSPTGDNSGQVPQIPGKPLRFLDRLEHEHEVLAADMTAGSLVATCDGTNVKLWKLDDSTSTKLDVPYEQQVLATLPHQDHLQLLEFSEDGTRLATLQKDGLLRVWRLDQQDLAHYRVQVPRSGSQAKMIGRDRWLVTGLSRYSRNHGRNGMVENATIYSQQTGKLIGQSSADLEVNGPIMDAACSPDHRQLATIHAHPERSAETIKRDDGSAGSIQLWEWPAFESSNLPIELPGEPRSVEYSPDGGQLAICTKNLEIVLVDPISGAVQDILVPQDTYGNTVQQHLNAAGHYDNGKLKFSPDGSTIVVWGSLEGVWVWDIESRSLRFPPIQNNRKFATRVEFSPDGKHIAIAGGRHPVVQVIELETGEIVGQKIFQTSVVNAASFSPDGSAIVAAIRDGKAVIYDWSSGQVSQALVVEDVDIVASRFTPDGRFILTLGLDHHLRVWCTSDYRMAMKPIPTPAWARQILVSKDSRYVVIASGRHEIAGIDLNACQGTLSYDLNKTIVASELVSGKSIHDDILEPLDTAAWYTRWEKFRRFE